jgi:hypothetical protein
VTMGTGALDAEARCRRQRLVVTLEHRPQRLDLGGGPVGEIRQGALAGAAAFAPDTVEPVKRFFGAS